jgi:hypothetical protein
VLNLDPIAIREIHPWARIGIPMSLLVGLVGVVQHNRVVSLATAVVFWIGAVLFFSVVIGTVVPRDWIFDPLNIPGPNRIFLALRFVFLISVAALLAVLFRSLKKTRYPDASGGKAVD